HDEAFRSNAGLSVINRARFYGRSYCFFEIRRRHDDERIAATEFEHRLLDLFPCDARHAAPCGFASSERCSDDTRVFEYALHNIGTNQQSLKRAFREPGPTEDVLNRQRTLRYVRRVLEQPHVTSHQCGRSETKDLPKRKIP